MPTRKGTAQWKGSLAEGEGKLSFGGNDFPYSFPSRFEDGDGTSPEELIAAAHAGCFAMALANELSESGYEVRSINASAEVRLNQVDGDFVIDKIALRVEADVAEIDVDVFKEYAGGAKRNCPVSNALSNVSDITLYAELKS